MRRQLTLIQVLFRVLVFRCAGLREDKAIYRLSWNSIANETWIPQKIPTNVEKYRSEFKGDYHRIIHNASFRRLQDKTQVFPLDNSDSVCIELMHSLGISSIAKLISKQVCIQVLDQQLTPAGGQPGSLKVIETLNCTGLLYDIGNPPFGHLGESAIRNWLEKNPSLLQFKQWPLQAWLDEQQQADLPYYEGNAQALCMITRLHRLIGQSGMHLTSSVMNTVTKYPVNSPEELAEDTKEKSKRSLLRKKVGCYQNETGQLLEIKQDIGTTGRRDPLCFILETTDGLAYTFTDLGDGYKKGLYSYEQLLDVIVEAQDERGTELLRQGLEEGRQLKKASEEGFDPYQHVVFTWLIKKQLFSISDVSDTFLKHYNTIMNGEFDQELFTVSKEGQLIRSLKQFAFDRVYNDVAILKLELMRNEVATFLLNCFMDALLPHDNGLNMSEIQEKYVDLLSGSYSNTYQRTAQDGEDSE